MSRGRAAALGAAALALLAGCGSAATTAPGTPAPSSAAPLTRLVYAAQDDGTVHVYDVDHGHRPVTTIPVFPCCADVRGAAAAVPAHRLYVMYNRDGHGHVAALDLLTDRVLWDRILHSPGIDRGSVTPDGRTLYLPTWEDDPGSPYELVVDARTGDEIARIALPPRSHDTVVSLDGRRVYMETKSPTAALYVADTATDRIVGMVTGYCCGGVLAPFSVNRAGTRVVDDVNGYAGFEVGDLGSGRVVASVPFPGGSGSGGHGIAWTPDEREVWVDDGTQPAVHVFDMTTAPPRQTHLVTVSHGGPHWVTFGIDGRYAYVAGRKGSGDVTDVVDAVTYARIATLGPSEDLLEVDLRGGAVVAVGDQFGLGRA